MKRGVYLMLFGGLLLALSTFFETAHVLYVMGFSISQEFKIASEAKIFLSLCIFFGLTAASLAFASSYISWKGYTKVAGFTSVAASCIALINIIVPFVYGYETYQIFAMGTILGVSLIGIGFDLTSSIAVTEVKGPILSSREVAVVAVLSAAYAALIVTVKVPSPTGGYTHIGDLVVFVAALLFGYKVGGLVGIVGAVAADFYVGYERWFVSILAHGLEGFIPGLARGKSLLIQAIACVVGGFLMATTYFIINIFIKGYPPALISYLRDLFVQAGISIVVGLAIARTVKRVLPQL